MDRDWGSDLSYDGETVNGVSIKREFVEETIPVVTINTKLRNGAKRLKGTDELPGTFTEAGCAPGSEIRVDEAALGNIQIHEQDRTQQNAMRQHLLLQNVTAQNNFLHQSVKNLQPNVTPPGVTRDTAIPPAQDTSSSTTGASSRQPSIQTHTVPSGSGIGEVRVDIPEHINQCLGLFKDCTIQNVTINIYLNKAKD